MLRAELRINNLLISVVSIVNTGAEKDGEIIYSVEAYVGHTDINEHGYASNFNVMHKKSDGAFVLTAKVLQALANHEKKKVKEKYGG